MSGIKISLGHKSNRVEKKKVVIFNNSNSYLLYHHCHSLKRSFQNGKERCLDKRAIWDQILPEKVVYHKGVSK